MKTSSVYMCQLRCVHMYAYIHTIPLKRGKFVELPQEEVQTPVKCHTWISIVVVKYQTQWSLDLNKYSCTFKLSHQRWHTLFLSVIKKIISLYKRNGHWIWINTLVHSNIKRNGHWIWINTLVHSNIKRYGRTFKYQTQWSIDLNKYSCTFCIAYHVLLSTSTAYHLLISYTIHTFISYTIHMLMCQCSLWWIGRWCTH